MYLHFPPTTHCCLGGYAPEIGHLFRDLLTLDFTHGIGYKWLVNDGMAWAFAPLTGIPAYYTEIAPNFHPESRPVVGFFNDSARDTEWLVERELDLVYTQGLVENEDLMQVHNNIYLLQK